MTTAQLADSLDDVEPQAGAPRGGGEEGVQDPFRHRRIDPAARIGDVDPDQVIAEAISVSGGVLKFKLLI